MTSSTYSARKAVGRETDAVDAPGGPDVRSRIRAAARDMVSEYGFSQVFSDRMRRYAKVSKSSPYKHVGDMAGFFSAVVKNRTACVSGLDRSRTVCVAVRKAVRAADALGGGLLRSASKITLCALGSAAGA